MRVAARVLGREADEPEQLAHLRGDLAPRVGVVDPHRQRDARADPLARVQRRVRVLEDHLHVAPDRPQRRAAERRDVAPVELDGARGQVGEPEQHARRASTCRSPTRRRARASRPAGPRGRRRRPRAPARPRAASGRPSGRGSACARRSRAAGRRSCRVRSQGWAGLSSGRWQASRWSGARFAASGGSSSQRSNRCGQRGANAQPVAGPLAVGGAPGIAVSRRGRGRSSRGIEPSRPTCRGAADRGRPRCVGPCSTTRPAYITRIRSAISATTPMSCVISTTDIRVSLPQRADQLEDLRLDRDVERRRRLVRDQHASGRTRAPSRSSPAGASRPRTGAGSRRRAARAPGCRPTASSSIARSRAAGGVEVRVRADLLRDLPADRVDRVERASSGPGRSSRSRGRGRPASRPGRARSGRARRSAPRPRARAACSSSSRITLIIETLLPEPDSPTMPSTSSAPSANETPSTARTEPRVGAEGDAQVAHVEQRVAHAHASRIRGSSRA